MTAFPAFLSITVTLVIAALATGTGVTFALILLGVLLVLVFRWSKAA